MRTPQEQAAWEQQCYGCSVDELRDTVERHGKPPMGCPGMVAMSMLSDAQEELNMRRGEDARQTINRAKWIIRTYLMSVT